MSSSLGGGGGRDCGHIRFALTTITETFAASSGRGKIYTAGRRRGWLCLPLPGEDEPEEKKEKPGSASRRRHVFRERSGKGWRWLGSSRVRRELGNSPSFPLEPFPGSSQCLSCVVLP